MGCLLSACKVLGTENPKIQTYLGSDLGTFIDAYACVARESGIVIGNTMTDDARERTG